MNFIESVKSCFEKYATFSGRASRPEYWYWILFTLIASFILDLIGASLLGFNLAEGAKYNIFSALFSLVTFLPGLAVSARRLHDVNRSGWWMLIAFTIIGLIPLTIWYCQKGTEGDNRFGKDPLENAQL